MTVSRSSSAPPNCSEISTNSSDNSKNSPWENKNATSTSTKKHNQTDIARRLVISSKLLSHGAAKVCHQLFGGGIEILIPCHSAIHKIIYTRAAQVKKNLMGTLHLGKWSIYFDDKRIQGFEYQAVVLNNEAKEKKLTTLKLKNEKAETIAELHCVREVYSVGISCEDCCQHNK